MPSRPFWLLVPALAAAAWPRAAAADDGADHALAVSTFEEARKLIDAGDCAQALPRLRESIRYEASVGARLSIADCTESTDPVEAWTNLREAERLAYLRHDDRLNVARSRAAALEPRVPLVHVAIPAALLVEQGLELRVDGALVDRYFYADGVVAMAAGSHVLEAILPGRRWSQTVVAQPGTTASVDVRMVDTCPARPPPAAEAAPVPAAAAAQPGSPLRGWMWVLAGVGATGLAAGTVLGVVSLQKRADIDSACGGNAATCTAAPGSLDAANASRRDTATASLVSFVLGGAALAGAAVLYFVAPRATETRGRVGVAAGIAPGGASLGLTGAW